MKKEINIFSLLPAMMCPFYKNLGCWNDFDSRKNPRMTKYIFNDRDRTDIGWSGIEISWDTWQYGYLQELICRCAKAAKENGMKYFSIQYYGEYTRSQRQERGQRVNKDLNHPISREFLLLVSAYRRVHCNLECSID